jgi:pyruvate,water dikinase
VGLARLEFIINRMIGVHPRAMLEFERLPPDLKEVDAGRWRATPIRSSSTSRLAEGIADRRGVRARAR